MCPIRLFLLPRELIQYSLYAQLTCVNRIGYFSLSSSKQEDIRLSFRKRNINIIYIEELYSRALHDELEWNSFVCVSQLPTRPHWFSIIRNKLNALTHQFWHEPPRNSTAEVDEGREEKDIIYAFFCCDSGSRNLNPKDKTQSLLFHLKLFCA